MSADNPVMVQPVEYLGLAEGMAGSPPGEEQVVIITIRPEPSSFYPHNIALPRAQAERLWQDLGTVLNRSAVLLLCGLLAATVGCSAKVEVESANWTAPASVSSQSQVSTGEKARTAVELDLLQSRSQEPVATSKPLEPPQPKPVVSEEKPLNISGNTFVFNYRGGDVTCHYETHVHFHEAPRRQVEERITTHRDAEIKPRRPVDERCERMAREHEERVRRWKASP